MKFGLLAGTNQRPFETSQILSNRDHEAINGGTLGARRFVTLALGSKAILWGHSEKIQGVSGAQGYKLSYKPIE